MGLFNVIKDAISPITELIDKAVTDKDLRNKLNNEIQGKLINNITQTLKDRSDVVIAEISSDNWLAQSWRPILMLSFTAIIVNNYIISPYLQAMFSFSVKLPVPKELWELLKIGIGGYVVGASVENSIKHWKNK
jgi:hypothetical protein